MPAEQGFDGAAPLEEPELLLVHHAGRGANGRMQVFSGASPAGEVILAQGRVAWATCARQPETLGRFLARLGHVTAAQLVQVDAEYARRGGTAKLGHVLQELGLVSRPLLRRCLLLHVRMALACLFRLPAARASWKEGTFCTEDELSFGLDQVLPDWHGLQVGVAGVTLQNAADFVPGALAALDQLPGFRGAMVVDWVGRVVAIHGFLHEHHEQARQLATAAAALLEGSAPPGAACLGEPAQVVLDGSRGSLVARWLDHRQRLLVAVVLAEQGRTGATLHRLATAGPAILEAFGVKE